MAFMQALSGVIHSMGTRLSPETTEVMDAADDLMEVLAQMLVQKNGDEKIQK